jgi:hypothetical protein
MSIRLSGAQATRVREELTRCFSSRIEVQRFEHEHDEQCSDKCERKYDYEEISPLEPPQWELETMVEDILKIVLPQAEVSIGAGL